MATTNTTATVNVSEITVNATDPTKTGWGANLADESYYAIATGTGDNETFDAADLTAETRGRMATHQRGVTTNMGAGDDTVIGSAFGDAISAGAGVNHVDGGAHDGTQPWGGKSRDMLDVYVADAAAAEAVTVVGLSASSTGADATAFADGYKFKVTNGAVETTYIKGIEQVNLRLADDRSFLKSITLVVQVHEIGGTAAELDNMHYAWAHGSAGADSFDAATDISGATQALMADNGRGVYVDTGAGNDTVTGSAYGDNIIAGAGTNYIDGGANGGTTPWGGKPEDVLQITVASAAEAAAVTVSALAGSSDAADIAAAAQGYTHKVVNGSTSTDYIQGIERVSVQVFDGANWSHGREIALAVRVHEANLADPNIDDYHHVAWVDGTADAETIDLAAPGFLTAPLASQMESGLQGAWIDGGAGNDIITGTAYADAIRNGAGNAKIDGGANASADGRFGKDVFEISVANQAALDAIQVVASDDPDYTWMVTYGANSTQKDYLKNIEGVNAYVEGGANGKWIPLALDIHEIQGTDVAGNMHFAWVNGTALGDAFNAATDVSAATRALMDTHGRGVYIDTGAGDDTVTGSAYGDDIYAGAGTNRVDGGANNGLRPYGGKAEDVLRITVSSAAAADAVVVTALDGTNGSALDNTEFTSGGYTHKVVNGDTVTYIKNIERINVEVRVGDTWSFGRDIPLAVSVHEANLADANIADYYHVAWVNGTAGAEAINLSNGSLLSSQIIAQMSAGKQGAWVDGGAGDDVITGTGFADAFRNGAGNSKIDGGANIAPEGRWGKDVFEIAVANQAALDAVQVVASDDPNYTWMVTYGANSTQKDYLKNIEGVSIYTEGGGNGKWIPLSIDINEVRAADVGTSYHFAWAHGTAQADSFNAETDVSAATRTLMATHGRGVYADTGAGNDTITGSAFADHFNAGAGNDYIDGGLNGGTVPHGGKPEDVLQLVVASAAAAAQVQVVDLSASSTGADAEAFGAGFTHKVVQPAAGGETDYIKGIERISIQVFDGANWSYGRDIALALNVAEIAPDANLANYSQFAWAYGTEGADTFNAATDISATTRALMDTHKRGVYVEASGGNDTITGSAYGDYLSGGKGTNYVDGGANAGTNMGGSKALDILTVTVATAAEASAIVVTDLSGATGSAADIAAFNSGYTHKVVSGAAQTDYFKNIEAVDVQVFDGTNHTFGRRISLALTVNETDLSDPEQANYTWLANVTGTAGKDVIDMSAATTLLSDAIKAEMASSKRGVYVDGGNGDDIITGTGYADSVRNGSGSSKIDGGANAANPDRENRDRFDIQVSSQAELDAVVVSQSDDPAYTWMVTYGPGSTQKDYLKNIEAVSVFVNGGGHRWIPLAVEINENLDADISNTFHLVSAFGTQGNDTFNATTDTSAEARTAMSTHGRGVYVDGREGNDTVTGSAYGDHIVGGAGTNYIDGGANGGTVPFGGRPTDVLGVTAASKADLDSLAITALSGSSTGADLAAFNSGYLFKLVNGASEVDYFKNIEQISATHWNDANGNQMHDDGETSFKSINLAVNIYEEQADPAKPGYLLNGAKIADMYHLANVTGTDFDDSFTVLDLSADARALMDTHQRGVYLQSGAGNDSITGSGYGDNFILGSGVNHLDGGANAGTNSFGQPMVDRLEVYVADQAAAAATTLVKLDASFTATADAAAFANGYTHKISTGGETDYIKNVEQVDLFVWDDKNGDGQRWHANPSDPLNEVTFVSSLLSTPVNQAPNLYDFSAGVSLVTIGKDYISESAALLPGGKIINLGYLSMDGVTYQWALTRLNADGTLDTTFGNGGYSIVSENNVASAAELRVQDDGKVVVGVTYKGADVDFKVVRTNADGSVDTSFGNGTGSVLVNAGSGDDHFSGIALTASGKIVVSGIAGPVGDWTGADTGMALVQLNADGSVDTGFGSNGKLVLPGGALSDSAYDVAVQADGSLLLTGSSNTGGKTDLVVARVTATGTLDAAFGTAGIAKIAVSELGNDSGRVAVVQPDGKILVAARAMIGPDDDFSIVRLNTDGTLDSSFGTAGVASVRVSEWHDNASDITLQPDGKILVGGSSGHYGIDGIEAFGLVRLNVNGTVDASFGGGDGIVVTRPGDFANYSRTVLVQPDGKIAVVGMAAKDADYNGSLVMVRLNADGSPDTSVDSHFIGYSASAGPVALAPLAMVYDSFLSSSNYDGATLTVSRQGGADTDDTFSAIGETLFTSGALTVEGVHIGTVSNTGGVLTMQFDTDASEYLVTMAMRDIAYATTETGVASVTLDFKFSDGNTGAQGMGDGLFDSTSIVVALIGVPAA